MRNKDLQAHGLAASGWEAEALARRVAETAWRAEHPTHAAYLDELGEFPSVKAREGMAIIAEAVAPILQGAFASDSLRVESLEAQLGVLAGEHHAALNAIKELLRAVSVTTVSGSNAGGLALAIAEARAILRAHAGKGGDA